jgi:hypothetical protein
VLPVRIGAMDAGLNGETAQMLMDTEDDNPLDRVSERDLRRIFCGLVE